MAWWCTLLDVKAAMGESDVEEYDDRNDGALRDVLDAAVAYVRRVRPEFGYDQTSQLPPPPADIRHGCARLTVRWWERRKSPDGLVVAGMEQGTARVPAVDPDIERLLGIGRYRGPVIA